MALRRRAAPSSAGRTLALADAALSPVTAAASPTGGPATAPRPVAGSGARGVRRADDARGRLVGALDPHYSGAPRSACACAGSTRAAPGRSEGPAESLAKRLRGRAPRGSTGDAPRALRARGASRRRLEGQVIDRRSFALLVEPARAISAQLPPARAGGSGASARARGAAGRASRRAAPSRGARRCTAGRRAAPRL